MTFRIELLISLFAAILVGVGGGALWWAPSHAAPAVEAHVAAAVAGDGPAAEPPRSEAPDGKAPAALADAPVAPAAAPGDEARTPSGGDQAAGPTPATAPAGASDPDAAAGDQGDAPGNLLPAQIEASADTDPSLIARGPGKFAFLLIGEAGLKTMLVRQGALERDGDGRFAPFAKAPVVARLRGPEARVELLHVGFDRDGHATLAHIRVPGTTAPKPTTAPLAAAASVAKGVAATADPSESWVEGVVSLEHGKGTVRLRAEAPLEPPAEAPIDEDVDR